MTFRAQSTGTIYAWELERGPRTWRVAARGGVITSDSEQSVAMAEAGLGLAYAMEPAVAERIRAGSLQPVLEPYAPTVPGFFLYYPSAAQRSAPLRLFIEAARELSSKQTSARSDASRPLRSPRSRR